MIVNLGVSILLFTLTSKTFDYVSYRVSGGNFFGTYDPQYFVIMVFYK